MTDQPQLDLPPVPSSAPRPSPVRRLAGFGGFTRAQLVLGLLVLILLVWGMWVTRALTVPKQEHIVSARLSSLVGDYVEAQRFSGSPPDRVQTEMRAFMASLDKELQRRGENGQVVLVGEAVLTKNVPDITDSLKKAVFAAGVPEPKRMSVEQLQRLQELSNAQAAPAAAREQPQAPVGTVDPLGGPTGAGETMFVDPLSSPTAPVPQAQVAAPGASVSTFGGPNGGSGQ